MTGCDLHIRDGLARFGRALLLAIALVVIGIGPAIADVEAQLGQSQVAFGDSFNLEIRVDGSSANQPPDLTPLEADFEVLGTSQSTQTSVVNGNVSASRSWIVRLQPRSIGTLTIPPIDVGGEQSQPLSIEVLDPASLPRGDLASIGLQIDVEAPDGPFYVQQQIPVTVRILDAAGLRQARLTPLELENATVTQSGEDRVQSVTVQGRPVAMIERTYLVTPQRSGSLDIPPLALRGVVPDPNGRGTGPFRNDPFAAMRERFGLPGFGGSLFDDFMNPGREVIARSRPITLDIQAQPAGSGGWFLPARNVELRAAWTPENPTFAVGEAATRIVQLVALGATQDQLPEVTFSDVTGARIYVDRVDERQIDTPDGTAAVRQYSLSIVPTQGGEVVLPPVEVNWFDTMSETEQTAVLPAETIIVAGAAPATQEPARSETAPSAATADPADDARATPPEGDLPSWTVWASGAGGLAVLALGLWWVLSRRAHRPEVATKPTVAAVAAAKASEPQASAEATELAGKLRTACKRNDLTEAYRHLSSWLNMTGRDRLSRPDPEAEALRRQMTALEQHIYATEPRTAWTGADLLRAFEAYRKGLGKQVETRTLRGDIPELYPRIRVSAP